jgi:hypothetical protein
MTAGITRGCPQSGSRSSAREQLEAGAGGDEASATPAPPRRSRDRTRAREHVAPGAQEPTPGTAVTAAPRRARVKQGPKAQAREEDALRRRRSSVAIARRASRAAAAIRERHREQVAASDSASCAPAVSTAPATSTSTRVDSTAAAAAFGREDILVRAPARRAEGRAHDTTCSGRGRRRGTSVPAGQDPVAADALHDAIVGADAALGLRRVRADDVDVEPAGPPAP